MLPAPCYPSIYQQSNPQDDTTKVLYWLVNQNMPYLFRARLAAIHGNLNPSIVMNVRHIGVARPNRRTTTYCWLQSNLDISIAPQL